MEQIFIVKSFFIILGIVGVIILTSKFKFNTFFSLLLVSLVLALATLPIGLIIPVLKQGFGHTMESIGILIILGTAIGVILDKTRATLSMATYILSKVGSQNATQAISISGFMIGLPIFCDSGFIVLSGLNKSLARKTKTSMAIMAGALATGLYSVHCLIPPHPGASAAAGIINCNVGILMLLGIGLAIPCALAGYVCSNLIGKKYAPERPGKEDDMKKEAEENLPSAGRSFLPVFIPILLIALKAVVLLFVKNSDYFLIKILVFAGEPIVALGIGLILSILLIKVKTKAFLNQLLEESIEKAGPILVIIAAGGAFGAVIKATGVGEETSKLLAGTGMGLLIPFIITSILKTAQGSSTVAIITAASMVSPLLPALGLDSEWGKILTVLSMGSGSMMISHANDAYFWVITKFSDLNPDTTLKVYSTATILMGLVGLLEVYLLSLVLL